MPRNPNETKGVYVDEKSKPGQTGQQACPRCGMEQNQWAGNQGKGIKKNNQMYCCEGCAENIGCNC